jgi:hypothetical protein
MNYVEQIENDWRDSTGEIDAGRVTWLIDSVKLAIVALKRYEDPEKWFTSFSGEECFILDEETFGNEIAQKALLEINKGFNPVSDLSVKE